MKFIYTHIILIGLLLAAPYPALAQDYPTTGLVYNTKEDSMITYRCEKTGNSSLECEFNQTSVRRNKKAEKWPEELEKAKADFKKEDFKSCTEKDFSKFIGLLDGSVAPETPEQKEKMAAASPEEKEYFSRFGKLMKAMCEKKDEGSFIDLMKLSFERDLKTCRVSSNAFKQKFKFVTDYVSEGGAWVVDSSPSGPCGAVQLDRFEVAETSGKIKFWKYIAKKAITNPKGKIFLGECSELDGEEYLYDWKQNRSEYFGCDYIQFSVF